MNEHYAHNWPAVVGDFGTEEPPFAEYDFGDDGDDSNDEEIEALSLVMLDGHGEIPRFDSPAVEGWWRDREQECLHRHGLVGTFPNFAAAQDHARANFRSRCAICLQTATGLYLVFDTRASEAARAAA